jgi:homoaconitase/3-isopropylmalate dehydratase large subunit
VFAVDGKVQDDEDVISSTDENLNGKMGWKGGS